MSEELVPLEEEAGESYIESEASEDEETSDLEEVDVSVVLLEAMVKRTEAIEKLSRGQIPIDDVVAILSASLKLPKRRRRRRS